MVMTYDPLTPVGKTSTLAVGPLVTTMVIPSTRFVLRPLQISDIGPMQMATSDLRVAASTSSIPHPLPPGATEAFVDRAIRGVGGEMVWVIDGSGFGLSEVLGVMSLRPMDRGQSSIGYWVAPAYWNSGIASEALRALVTANPLGNSTIFGQAFQDNPASARVMTNVGFVYIGDAELFCVARGVVLPTWTYLLNYA